MKAADLVVSPGPHLHCGATFTGAPYDTLLALLPAAVVGVIRYGLEAVGVIGVAVAAAMIAEWAMQKMLRRPVALADGTAALSGLMLALIMPASVPFMIVIVASAAGIIIGKACFGGRGANPLNPALVGYAVVAICKPWAGFLDFDLALVNCEPGFPIAFPLAKLKALGTAGIADLHTSDLFLGLQTGGIGSSATVFVLLGGLYLVARGHVRWQIPLCLLAGVFLTAGLFHLADDAAYAEPLFHLVTGNVVIGAFFLATEHSASPVNRWGMVVYGLGCGALIVVLRAWSTYPDSVVFAVLLMGLFVPLMDKLKARQVVIRPVAETTTGGSAGS